MGHPRPLKAKAGERVRFRVVAAGPDDGVAFHVVDPSMRHADGGAHGTVEVSG
ncbi:hypothetical protein [Streptomyces sp. CRN 30]|uniref:hypothetical protein n=1 Tax=Streptomyces sp. CRN 30 TaxID=3075613 RepID=UPI002A81072E|nr:hypothetical protein [Streptomyces sp. CRN 30]